MNVQLREITMTGRDGRVSQLEQLYIRGSHIRYFVVPDMLKNAPMFKTMLPGALRGRGQGRGKANLSRPAGKSPCDFPLKLRSSRPWPRYARRFHATRKVFWWTLSSSVYLLDFLVSVIRLLSTLKNPTEIHKHDELFNSKEAHFLNFTF